MLDVTGSTPAWSRTVATSRAHLRSITDPSSRRSRRVSVARRLVGVLVAATPAGAKAADGARAAVAVVARVALENLVDDGSMIGEPLISRPWLAVQLGCAPLAAGRHLKTAAAAGWLTAVGHRPGSAQSWKPNRVADPTVRLAIEDHAQLVDDLADGAATPATEAVLSVGHAAWSFGPLGTRGWLALVAARLDIDPVAAWGWPTRTARATTRALAQAGLLDAGPASLTARLNTLAHTAPADGGPTPAQAANAAEDHRRAEAAARKAAVLEVRAARDEAASERRREIAAARAAKRTAGRPTTSTSKRPTPPPPPAPAEKLKTVNLPSDYDPVRHATALERLMSSRGLELVEVRADEGVALGRPIAARAQSA